MTLDQIRNEKREYFLNEFNGAALVGKIVKRERVNVNDFQMFRYTIRIKEYWLGIKFPTVVVYGEPEEQVFRSLRVGSSCGFRLAIGKTYFFTPYIYENKLQIGLCDFAGGGSDPSSYPATEFRKIMGEANRF